MFISNNTVIMKIVRRLSKAMNVPLGRHIIVTKKTEQGIFARNVGERSEYWLADSLKNFAEVSNVSCKLNKAEFEALKFAVIINHTLAGIHNKQWKVIVKEKPTIIRFWYPGGGCIYIWPSVIKQRVTGGEPYVYIEIHSRCFERPPKKGGVSK